MAGIVSDSETIRRQNRALLLDALRAHGPIPRTQLAAVTGLSHASITAITQDMLAQGVLLDAMEQEEGQKARGRPALKVGLNRNRAAVCLLEIQMRRVRLSLVDYAGVLHDRIEIPLTPKSFVEADPAALLSASIRKIGARNPEQFSRLRRVAIAVQGILDKTAGGLAWSPVPNLAGHNLAEGLSGAFGVPVSVIKRGGLLAEGARQLDPELKNAAVATVFIGATVAMGLSGPADDPRASELAGTEFGHMNHIPEGALCRCGMRGCIEAYAADYGVLRTAYSVPENTPPAPLVPTGEFDHLVGRANGGDKSAAHAFRLAGRAVGYGLNRLLAFYEPAYVVLVGPGTRAFGLLRGEIQAALSASLLGRIRGLPEIRMLHDETEPIFQGLLSRTLKDLDHAEIAALTPLPVPGYAS